MGDMATTPNFTDDAVPVVKDGATRVREWRARNPTAAASQKTSYRRRNSKWQTDASYLSRPFVAWDGEGITLADGRHVYIMLAVLGGGVEDYTFNPKGLDTIDAFEMVLRNGEETKGAIHVIYGGGYDFNMWLRDVPLPTLKRLYQGRYVTWNNYRFMWRPGKSFYLARIRADGTMYDAVTIYDVAPFFQCPFVKACDDYLGAEFYERETVVSNKALRSSFTMADAPHMRHYNHIELINLGRLMVELRKRLNTCGLRPKRWDGPGAIAAALLKREGVQRAMSDTPPLVARAARHAYAGGRFEVIRFGHVETPAFEYDVNSAYPTALRHVPNLAAGSWRRVEGDPGPHPYALYRVRYRGENPAIPGAFFRRADNGTICYPLAVTGWYWSPEVEVGREYCARGHGTMEITEAWVFDEGDAPKPFAFIDELYRARQIFKAQGNGAHVGIKLGLNSLYGKLAQQVGARMEKDGTWRIPPFHQIEWAGYVTAHCRASVLRACLDNLDAVIAFETDAVFTSEPLPVETGTGLGLFESIEFESLTYVQSGVYFGTAGGKQIEKTRGVDRGNVHVEDALAAFAEPHAHDRYIPSQLTRFIGLGVALAQGMHKWARWETMGKRITVEPSGKREHADCWCMKRTGRGLALGRWHMTACPFINDAESAEFPVMWANPNPAMTELEERRNAPVEWD